MGPASAGDGIVAVVGGAIPLVSSAANPPVSNIATPPSATPTRGWVMAPIMHTMSAQKANAGLRTPSCTARLMSDASSISTTANVHSASVIGKCRVALRRAAKPHSSPNAVSPATSPMRAPEPICAGIVASTAAHASAAAELAPKKNRPMIRAADSGCPASAVRGASVAMLH